MTQEEQCARAVLTDDEVERWCFEEVVHCLDRCDHDECRTRRRFGKLAESHERLREAAYREKPPCATRDTLPHPMQPIILDADGVIRFKVNAIVRHLLDFASARGCSLNEIAGLPFTIEDRVQLAQLIGYSVSGFGELNYAPANVVDAADREAERLMKLKGTP